MGTPRQFFQPVGGKRNMLYLWQLGLYQLQPWGSPKDENPWLQRGRTNEARRQSNERESDEQSAGARRQRKVQSDTVQLARHPERKE